MDAKPLTPELEAEYRTTLSDDGWWTNEEVAGIFATLDATRAEVARLKAENLEWLAAWREYTNAENYRDELAAENKLEALRFGSADVNTPPSVVQALRIRLGELQAERDAARADLREVVASRDALLQRTNVSRCYCDACGWKSEPMDHDAAAFAIMWHRQTCDSHPLRKTKEKLAVVEGERDALKATVEGLNQMLRATGYGQGQIDSYVAECEENDTLRQLLAECRPVVEDATAWPATPELGEVNKELLARIDAALVDVAQEARP